MAKAKALTDAQRRAVIEMVIEVEAVIHERDRLDDERIAVNAVDYAFYRGVAEGARRMRASISECIGKGGLT
jgi:hypothetical protein